MYTPPLSTGLSGAGPRLRAYLDTLPELTSPSRRAALYADLSLLRDTNPYAYERALSWWQQVVVGAARAGATSEMPSASNQQAKQCVFCVLPGSLAAAFERDGIRPAALVTVLETMERKGEIRRMESYAPLLRTWSGWAWNVVSTLPRRLWSNKTPDEQEFVIVSALEEAAQQAWNIHVSQLVYTTTDRLYTWEEFCTRLRQGPLATLLRNERDWELLLAQLEETGKVKVERSMQRADAHPQLIKFVLAEEIGCPIAVTETDHGLLNVRHTLHRITQQVDQLQKQMDTLRNEAKQWISSAHKQRALGCLRQCKEAERVLEKRLTAQEQLNTIITSVQQADSDAQVHRAFQQGTQAIKSIISNNGLSAEAIDQTMEQLEETLADQREIEEALATGQTAMNVDIEEEELNKELDALMLTASSSPVVEEKEMTESDQITERLKNLSILQALSNSVTTTEENTTTRTTAEAEAVTPAAITE